MSDHGSWDLLLSRYFEGCIQPEELSQLEKRLMEDDEIARQAAEWCLVHYQIGELLTEDQLHEFMDQFANRSPRLRQELFIKTLGVKRGVTKEIRQAATSGKRARVRTLSLAIAIAIVAVSF